MTQKNTIQENLDSQDDFIRNLYTDLDSRIQDFEKGSARIEKMKLGDAKGTLFIVSAIVVYLVVVIAG
ncbi:hypothetical protein ACFPRA_03225 [Sporosarcina soli]|uniref:Uncharacterized protein n=1 Tax=Sporosarcina soli TaxID=334736 RepID=A0ABW0TGB3_9BACL